jgi:hypothetical protein
VHLRLAYGVSSRVQDGAELMVLEIALGENLYPTVQCLRGRQV